VRRPGGDADTVAFIPVSTGQEIKAVLSDVFGTVVDMMPCT
jgi:hypothetical protein